MAHNVKCKVCGITFDRDKEEAVPVGGRRYAHKACAEGYEPSQEEKDLALLHEFLKSLFKKNYNYVVLDRQIKTFVDTLGYSYTGILKSLIYWYQVKQESLEKAEGRIGIVPYIYEDAKQYYLAQYLANEVNAGKDLKIFRQPEVRVIKIRPPVPEVPKYKLFDLDD